MKKSVAFFDAQFRQAATHATLQLDPFEEQALPFLRGDVLDLGCGMGNLALAAASTGCRVTALDASPAAVAHIRHRSAQKSVPLAPGSGV